LQNNIELPPTELPWPSGRVLGYSPDGAKLQVASVASGIVTVSTFDAENRELRTSREFSGQRLSAALFDPRHNLVPVGDKGDLVFYELDSGDIRSRLAGFYGDDAWQSVAVAALSPDCSRVVSETGGGITNRNNQITVWSLVTGRKLVSFDAPLLLNAIAFSEDGQRLLMRSRIWPNDQPAEIWDGAGLSDGK
jgi:hypothetical protein